MSHFSSELQNDPAWISLVGRVSKLEVKANVTSTMAFAQQDKRYRLALATMNSLISLGGTVTVNAKFSSSFTNTDYKIDVAIADTAGTVVPESSITVSNKSVSGCRITFPAPVALALGTIVGVLAISAPTQ